MSQELNLLKMLFDKGLTEEALKLEKQFKVDGKISELISSVRTENWLAKFITVHPLMLEMKDVVRKLANIPDCVLIQGESGTGKELIAQALHGSRDGNFVALNCTSLPDYLLESELFGHVRGAFTGATENKVGLFQYAHKGTIFLDEIGDMPVLLQAKLLRVLQDGKIRPVGSNEDKQVDTRVIAATHQDLTKNGFRKDLFWRISTFRIEILPLRDRIEDINLIAKSICKEFDNQFDLPLYGNVRELQQIVRRWQVIGK